MLQVSNGNVIIPKEEDKTFLIPKDIKITVNGVETTIPSGNYDINQVVYNPDGSIKSVRVICGDYKTWLHLDSNGDIAKVEYILGKNGVFTINNANYDIVDMYGNNIGKFQSGEYLDYHPMVNMRNGFIQMEILLMVIILFLIQFKKHKDQIYHYLIKIKDYLVY